MKNNAKYTLLLFLFLLASGLSSQDQRVIRDVVLLDKQPFEVLMSGNGDILSKIRHIPDYLKSDEKVERQITASGQAIAKKEVKTEVEPIVNDMAEVALNEEPKEEFKEAEKELVVQPMIPLEPAQRVVQNKDDMGDFKDYYEIEFKRETATLNASAIRTLNELALLLNNNPDQHVQVFGFQNESPIIAMLLSKRRRDACIAYLKIKGVRVDRQIKLGSINKGENNKIVFGLE